MLLAGLFVNRKNYTTYDFIRRTKLGVKIIFEIISNAQVGCY